MLNRERKRADEAEERLNLARQQYEERLAAERQRHDALLAELREERRQRQAEMREERRQNRAAQQQNQAVQQEMLARIAENQSILTRMLQQRQNGDGDNGPSTAS